MRRIESANGLGIEKRARLIQKNNPWDSSPESPSNRVMTQMIRILTLPGEAKALDHALTFVLAAAVVANAVCLWNYL